MASSCFEELVTWSGTVAAALPTEEPILITNVSGFLRVTAKEKLIPYYTWAHLFSI
jgi:hypothetical protein